MVSEKLWKNQRLLGPTPLLLSYKAYSSEHWTFAINYQLYLVVCRLHRQYYDNIYRIQVKPVGDVDPRYATGDSASTKMVLEVYLLRLLTTKVGCCWKNVILNPAFLLIWLRFSWIIQIILKMNCFLINDFSLYVGLNLHIRPRSIFEKYLKEP